jgi:hypothetical protein
LSLGSAAVSWRSHKQSVPAESTTEAKYVAVVEVTKGIVWLRKILEYLQEKQVNSTHLLVENTYAIKEKFVKFRIMLGLTHPLGLRGGILDM